MWEQRGVQPVIAVVFLVAIVILLASVLFVFVDGFQTEESPPQAATSEQFYSDFDLATGDTTPYLTLQHQGGETFQRENIRAVVTVGGQSFDNLSPEGPNTGPVRTNDELTYDLSSANLCGQPADEFTVRLVHTPTNKLIAKQRVDIRDEVDIGVSDNAVTSDIPYRATVTVVGRAASSYSGDQLEPDTLTARIVVNRPSGTEYLTPWPDGDPNDAITDRFDDNINRPYRNDGSPPITYTTEPLSADTSVTLEMRSGKPSGWDYSGSPPTVNRGGTEYDVGDPNAPLSQTRFWVDSGNSGEGNLVLRTDGESVPTYGQAGNHQRSLQDILGSQLDGDGNLNLDQNDVVVLYELTDPGAQPENAPDPGDTGNPDYNDGVAIIEIDPVPGASTSDPGTLYC